MDDYVVIDSLRKKRKTGVRSSRKQKKSKRTIKSEDDEQSQEVVDNFEDEGTEDQGEFKH